MHTLLFAQQRCLCSRGYEHPMKDSTAGVLEPNVLGCVLTQSPTASPTRSPTTGNGNYGNGGNYGNYGSGSGSWSPW